MLVNSGFWGGKLKPTYRSGFWG